MRFSSKILLISLALGVLVLSMAFSSAALFTYDTYYKNQANNYNSYSNYDRYYETSDHQSSSSSINDREAGYSRSQSNEREIKTINAENYPDIYVYPSGYNNPYSYATVKPGYDYHYVSPAFSCLGGKNCYYKNDNNYNNNEYVIHHSSTCDYYGNCYSYNEDIDYSNFRYQPYFADDYYYYNNYYSNNGNTYGEDYYYMPMMSSNGYYNWRY